MTPKNSKSDEINDICTNLLPGAGTDYFSADSVLLDSEQARFPTEFLNSINICGLPPHKLTLKIGQPIMLLRNVNPSVGLCNGTRLVIKDLYSRLIRAQILIGYSII